MKKTISQYRSISDTTSKNWIEFDKIIEVIRQPPLEIVNLTQRLNNLYSTDNNLYKQEKLKLPIFCASGCFKYRSGDLSNLEQYSNILILDFDWDNPKPDVIEEFRQKLIQYATALHIYSIWKSPAKGLKAALIHDNSDPARHSELFLSVKNNLFPKTPQLDMTGKDLARACFISYDNQIFINTDPNLVEYHFDPCQAPQPSPIQPISKKTSTSFGHFVHTPEERLLNGLYQGACSDKTLIEKMIKTFRATNPNYYMDGNRHAEVLRRATLFCKNGVLFENAVKSLIGQLGENSKAGLKNADIQSMVNSCYNKARGEFGVSRSTFLEKTRRKASN